MVDTPAKLALAVLEALSQDGVRWVYLRNYENLPDDVGNDVDLLVPAGQREVVADRMAAIAATHGWIELSRKSFGPLALFLGHLSTGSVLHFDILDRIEWHMVEIADAAMVLRERKWNGTVFVPRGADEVYLNVVIRLAYQGVIRPKHREQAAGLQADEGELEDVFSSNLGDHGARLLRQLRAHGWEPDAGSRRLLFAGILSSFVFRRAPAFLRGCSRYLLRVLKRLVRPQGRLIVLEGPDGVGKSTVLEELVPWTRSWCSGRQPFRFHWKPLRLETGAAPPSMPVDPRSEDPRGVLASLVYLTWHLAGFWWAYIFNIYPMLVRSHAVVGDRYSYDLFLDPRRFRLSLPDPLLFAACRLVPRPHFVLGLCADPATIRARKPELEEFEIEACQARWRQLGATGSHLIDVDANGSAGDTLDRCKAALLSAEASFGQ